MEGWQDARRRVRHTVLHTVLGDKKESKPAYVLYVSIAASVYTMMDGTVVEGFFQDDEFAGYFN